MSHLNLAVVLFGTLITAAYADNTQIGRYIEVQNIPTMSQTDLLSQTFHVRFDRSVKTIGEAMNQLLSGSGYALASGYSADEAVSAMLSSPLPFIDRDFGPMSLKAGLQTLAGPAFDLVSDPIYRKVSFILDKRFVKPVNQNQKTLAKRVKHHVK